MGTISSQITSLAIVYSTVYSDADQRKHQSSASLAFVRGIHRGPVNSPHKWPVTRRMFPFDDVIMLGVASQCYGTTSVCNGINLFSLKGGTQSQHHFFINFQNIISRTQPKSTKTRKFRIQMEFVWQKYMWLYMSANQGFLQSSLKFFGMWDVIMAHTAVATQSPRQSQAMRLLPDTQNCGLRMCRECRERFPRYRLQGKPLVSDPGMHHGTCITHVPWCMSGPLIRCGGENVPCIPGACATHNFTYLARGPLSQALMTHVYAQQ